MTISLKTINYFISHEDVILYSSKDRSGKKSLKCLKKGFWSFIAIKILHLKSFQLQRIVKIVKEQQFNSKTSQEIQSFKIFASRLNIKIAHYNNNHLNKKISPLEKINILFDKDPTTDHSIFAPSALELERIQNTKQQTVPRKNAAIEFLKPENFLPSDPASKILQLPSIAGIDKIQEFEQKMFFPNKHVPLKTPDVEVLETAKKPLENLKAFFEIPQAPCILELEKMQRDGQQNLVLPKVEQKQVLIEPQTEKKIPQERAKQQNKIKKITHSNEDLLKFLKFQLDQKTFKRLLIHCQKTNNKQARMILENEFKSKYQNENNDLEEFKKNHLKNLCGKRTLNYLNFFFKMPDTPLDAFSEELSEIFTAFIIYLIEILPGKSKMKCKVMSNEFWSKDNAEQNAILLEIHKELQKAFTEKFRESLPEQVCENLLKLTHFGNAKEYFTFALYDKEARENLKKALAWGINEGVLSSLQIRMLNEIVGKLTTLKKGKFAKTFFDTFEYIRENTVSFSRLYNNPYLSDQKFILGKEIFHVHKAIVRSIPSLQKYSLLDEAIVVIDENIDDVKLNLEIAYDLYHFDHFKNEFKDLLACKRHFESIFNNPQDSDFLIESSMGEKLYVHRAILECSDLEYFKAIFRNNETKLNVDQKEFEVLKVILEYIYFDQLPEFENEEFENDFWNKFDNYCAH